MGEIPGTSGTALSDPEPGERLTADEFGRRQRQAIRDLLEAPDTGFDPEYSDRDEVARLSSRSEENLDASATQDFADRLEAEWARAYADQAARSGR